MVQMKPGNVPLAAAIALSVLSTAASAGCLPGGCGDVAVGHYPTIHPPAALYYAPPPPRVAYAPYVVYRPVTQVGTEAAIVLRPARVKRLVPRYGRATVSAPRVYRGY
jgi:hypothetical protein